MVYISDFLWHLVAIRQPNINIYLNRGENEKYGGHFLWHLVAIRQPNINIYLNRGENEKYGGQIFTWCSSF
jgi:hypothetical protein